MPRGNDDLNWLYRDDEVEPTSVLPPDELEALRRSEGRRRSGRREQPPAAQQRPA
ncbi:MAG TPA: hypothetical protein GX013_11010, partial [Propionibacterium sp.]|nr:hypothetical protein [Propionibacterium sp.]